MKLSINVKIFWPLYSEDDALRKAYWMVLKDSSSVFVPKDLTRLLRHLQEGRGAASASVADAAIMFPLRNYINSSLGLNVSLTKIRTN